jgi:hypothetical protein
MGVRAKMAEVVLYLRFFFFFSFFCKGDEADFASGPQPATSSKPPKMAPILRSRSLRISYLDPDRLLRFYIVEYITESSNAMFHG